MPKRQALNQLTQDNWDEQEEREVPGTFQKLPEENLSNRVIKQARRRSINLGNTSPSSSPFASFKGFGNKIEARTSENGDINPSQHGNGAVLLTKQISLSKSEDSVIQQKNDTCRDLEYYRLLKCLNESLVSWVTQHLTKNPLCDFTPVFSDYKRHLEDLEMRFPVREDNSSLSVENIKENSSTVSQPQSTKPFESLPTEKNGSSGVAPKTTSENNTVNSSGAVLFGNLSSKESVLPPQNTLGASPVFSISKSVVAASSNTAVAATGFQFGNIANCSSSKSSVNTNSVADGGKADTNIFTIPTSNASTTENKPFSFSSAVIQNNERKEEQEESEENQEPPKNEFIPVVEKDAVYSKRCKLFYNKEGNYVEKGIGTLYLKPLNGKTQLVVRADTSLGNILLNIMLTSSLPVKRVGKNNVLIVCIPHPPIDPTKQKLSEPGPVTNGEVVPMLIRVKTEDDANELLKQIEESKSS